TDNKTRLLATILSRVQIIEVKPKFNTVKKWILEDIDIINHENIDIGRCAQWKVEACGSLGASQW
ncbi:MAG: hypothetical protein Q9M75_04840, partial [Ghiorsea sp.]|nr:hypothetical protein [Ghiorsea sp.]